MYDLWRSKIPERYGDEWKISYIHTVLYIKTCQRCNGRSCAIIIECRICKERRFLQKRRVSKNKEMKRISKEVDIKKVRRNTTTRLLTTYLLSEGNRKLFVAVDTLPRDIRYWIRVFYYVCVRVHPSTLNKVFFLFKKYVRYLYGKNWKK